MLKKSKQTLNKKILKQNQRQKWKVKSNGVKQPLKEAEKHQDSKSKLESSLSSLTSIFLNLLKKSKDGVIDLNKTVTQLKVQKWRIYDITNVLEGINYIQKVQKNKIKLVQQNTNQKTNKESVQLFAQLEALQKEEQEMEYQIKQNKELFQELLKQSQLKDSIYITDKDFRKLIDSSQIKTPFFLIQSSHQTELEYYTPMQQQTDQKLNFNAIISSKDPMEVFIANNDLELHSQTY